MTVKVSLTLVLFLVFAITGCKEVPNNIVMGTKSSDSGQSSDLSPPTNVTVVSSTTSTITSNVTFTATAADNVGIVKAIFYIDNNWIGEDGIGPDFTLNWSPSALYNGTHNISVKVFDAADNFTFSNSVGININVQYTIKVSQSSVNSGAVASALTYLHPTSVPSGGNSTDPSHYNCVEFKAGVVSPINETAFSGPPSNQPLQINFTGGPQVYTNNICTILPTSIGSNQNYISITANTTNTKFYLRMLPGTFTLTGTVQGQATKYFTASFTTPVTYPTKMVGGNNFACALLNTKAIKCWGINTFGQLGNGAVLDGAANSQKYPVDVVGINTAIDIAAGESHACALLQDYSVKCWGYAEFGRLGNGISTAIGYSTPVAVTGLAAGSLARKIFAGYRSTCVLMSNNQSLSCWGYNGSGSTTAGGFIGNHSPDSSAPNTTDKLIPTTITATSSLPAGYTISSLAMGLHHICAIVTVSAVNKVYCWGSNKYGQLGNSSVSSNDLSTLSAVANTTLTSGVTAINSKYNHTCAVVNTGVRCWGYSNFGQSGGTVIVNAQPTPQIIGSLTNVINVTTGTHFSCALTSTSTNGKIYCWGNSQNGHLGSTSINSGLTYELNPVLVTITPLNTATHIMSTTESSCAFFNSSIGVKCWGLNTYGQLANGTTTTSTPATPVSNAYSL